MDRIDLTQKAKQLWNKYKYVLLVIGIGIFLMSMPEAKPSAPTAVAQPEQIESVSKAEELEQILGQIAGVGKVKVLLTEAAGAETVYQSDADRTDSGDSQQEQMKTVIITDSGRAQEGLVRTITPPVYLGAIIVCQGGDSPTVRLNIVEAVSNVTGIGSDRITVLKMK